MIIYTFFRRLLNNFKEVMYIEKLFLKYRHYCSIFYEYFYFLFNISLRCLHRDHRKFFRDLVEHTHQFLCGSVLTRNNYKIDKYCSRCMLL